MSYTKDRETFVAAMVSECGIPPDDSRLILRHAQTIQRCAELACSSEAADRDRVPCPKGSQRDGACLCRDYGSHDGERHGDIPRYAVRDWRAERSIDKLGERYGFRAVYGGDPRGACVKLRVPSGKTDDWGQTGLCVPTRY